MYVTLKDAAAAISKLHNIELSYHRMRSNGKSGKFTIHRAGGTLVMTEEAMQEAIEFYRPRPL